MTSAHSADAVETALAAAECSNASKALMAPFYQSVMGCYLNPTSCGSTGTINGTYAVNAKRVLTMADQCALTPTSSACSSTGLAEQTTCITNKATCQFHLNALAWETTDTDNAACTPCASSGACFDAMGCANKEASGNNTFTGLYADCNAALGYCEACFPHSTCTTKADHKCTDATIAAATTCKATSVQCDALINTEGHVFTDYTVCANTTVAAAQTCATASNGCMEWFMWAESGSTTAANATWLTDCALSSTVKAGYDAAVTATSSLATCIAGALAGTSLATCSVEEAASVALCDTTAATCAGHLKNGTQATAEECTAASIAGYDGCLADFADCISTPELGAVCDFPLLAATQTLFSTCVGEWTTCDSTQACKLEATVDTLKACDAQTATCLSGLSGDNDADAASCSEAVLAELAKPNCLWRVEDCGAWVAARDLSADASDCASLGSFDSAYPNFMAFHDTVCAVDETLTPAPTAAPKVAMTVGQATPIAANIQAVYCSAMESIWVSKSGRVQDSTCVYKTPSSRRLLQDLYSMELQVKATAMNRNVAAFADTSAISSAVVAAIDTFAAAAGVTIDTSTLSVVTPVQETPEPTAEPSPAPEPAAPTPAPEPTPATETVPTTFYSGSSAVVPSIFGALSLAFLLL
jgi:hypothetical protein